nr:integrase, catalytic region, zinc finger, CCHC-type, peptidase aspartic, catalytic [Tanacetum cinerariifolium]
RDNVSSSESAPNFAELFETNELKAQIQEKDTVDVVPLIPKLRKNRTAHIDYLKHTLEEEATLRERVESESLHSPLNTPLAYACKYTRRIQELLMILQQTCPRITKLGTTLVAITPKNQNQQVRRVALASSASGSQSKDNTKKNRIQQTLKKAKETKLEDHPRKVKSSLIKASVVDSRASLSVIKSVSNVPANLKCASCNGCLFADNHDKCVAEYINSVNASRKSKSAKKPVNRKVVQIVLWYLDSGCSKHMTGDRSQLINFVQKFLATVKFRNDHVAKIMGYGDYQIGNVSGLLCGRTGAQLIFCRAVLHPRPNPGLASSLVTFELWCNQSSG